MKILMKITGGLGCPHLECLRLHLLRGLQKGRIHSKGAGRERRTQKFQTCAPGHPVSTESGMDVERGRAILGQPAGCPEI